MINSMRLVRTAHRCFAKKARKVREPPIEFDPATAFKIVKCHAVAPFNESLNLCVKLGIDPKRSDLALRGSCVLPAGIGRSKRIAFFGANEAQNRAAAEAGADISSPDEVLSQIREGVLDFEVLYATVESINALKPHARVLGPKGLYPNAKVNTLIKADEIEQAIKDAKAGKIDFKNDEWADIKVIIGKSSFEYDEFRTNLRSFMEYIHSKKPTNFKGRYFKKIYLNSTVGGKSYSLHLPMLDPTSASYALRA